MFKKTINVKLEFEDIECASFLATAIFDYIVDVDFNLKDNIGFVENDHTSIDDFFYSYLDNDLETKNKIENHIETFYEKFNTVKYFLENELENINDSNEFYASFKKACESINFETQLNNNLNIKKYKI